MRRGRGYDPGRDLLDLIDQLEDAVGRERILLGGFEHEGVAADERIRQEPERDHRREVERCDCRDDTYGLPVQLDVDAVRDALQRLSLEQVRRSARVLHRLNPPADLCVGVIEGLTHVQRHEPRKLIAVLDQRLSQRKDRARPLQR